MKIELIMHWDDPTASVAVTAYNLGMIRIAAETENIMYILSKINELYNSLKNKKEDGSNTPVVYSKRLIDDVIHSLIRLGSCESDLKEYPTIYGPRPDGVIFDVRTIKIERVHLIRALKPIRHL